MSAPCKDCDKRRLGCHDECKAYEEYSRNRQELLDKKNKEQKDVYDYKRARGLWSRQSGR